MKKTVILGVGNILRSDEGVGVHIVKELERFTVNGSRFTVIDGGTLGIDLIPFIENADKLIIVDAVKDGGKPGTVYKFRREDIHDTRYTIHDTRYSLHQINLIDTLNIMEIQNKLPKETVIIGVEPKNLGWGEELSEEIKKRIPEIKTLLEKEVRNACCSIKAK